MRPRERLRLLREVVDEMVRYKVGGDDKIRVANGACESVRRSTLVQPRSQPTLLIQLFVRAQLQTHIRQLDVTASLLIASLPPALESRIPDPTLPSGYPRLTGALRSKPSGGVWGDGLGFAGGSSGIVPVETAAFPGIPLGAHPDAVLGNALRAPNPAGVYGPAMIQEPMPGMPIMSTGAGSSMGPGGPGRARLHDYPGPAPNKTGRAAYMGHGIGPNGQAYALGPDGTISDRKIHHNQHTKKRAREAEAALMLGPRGVGSSGLSAQQHAPPGPTAPGQRGVPSYPPGATGGTVQTFGMAPAVHSHVQQGLTNGAGGPGMAPGGPGKTTNKRPRASVAPGGGYDGSVGGDVPGDPARVPKKRVKKNDDGSPRLMPSQGPPMNGNGPNGGASQGPRRRSPLSTGGSNAGSPALGHTGVPFNGTGAGQFGYASHAGNNVAPHRTVSGRQVNPPVRPGEELDGVPSWAITGSGQPPASYQASNGGNGNGNGRHHPNAAGGTGVGNGPKRGNSTASARSRARKLSTAEDDDDLDGAAGARGIDGTSGVPTSRARPRAGASGRNQAAAVAAAQKGLPYPGGDDEFEDELVEEGDDGGIEGEGNNSRLYCVCQTSGGDEPMVGCDNKNCPVEWVRSPAATSENGS